MEALRAEVFVPVTQEGVVAGTRRQQERYISGRLRAIAPSRSVNRTRCVGSEMGMVGAIYTTSNHVSPFAVRAWAKRDYIHLQGAPISLLTQDVEVDGDGQVVRSVGEPFTHLDVRSGRIKYAEEYRGYSEAQFEGLLAAVGVTVERLEQAYANPLVYANTLAI